MEHRDIRDEIDLAAGGPHYKKQPRDNHGRWTDTGQRLTSAAKDTAKRMVRASLSNKGSGPVSFKKVRRGRSHAYDVFSGDARLGQVYDNGARSYGRNWTAVDAKGAEVHRSGSRASAAEALSKRGNDNDEAKEKRLKAKEIATQAKVESKEPAAPVKSKSVHWDRKVDAATKRVHAKAVAVEPGISADLKASIGTGRLEGFEYRLKTADSLARKIQMLADDEFGGDVDKAEADIKDAVRYTAIWDKSTVVMEADKMLRDLKAKGHKVNKIKNYFGTPDPMGYRGVNAQMVAPDGHLYELQFHTPESFEAKMGEGHTFYEKWRELPPGHPEKAKWVERSRAYYAARVPPIPGAELLDGK